MRLRCDYCGCLIRYKCQSVRKPVGQTVAAGVRDTPESRELWRFKLLTAAPYEDVWCLDGVCSGCGGGHYGKVEITLDDAERLVAEQNALLELPESKFESEHWLEELDRRSQRDAETFGALFHARFPLLATVPERQNGLFKRTPIDEYWVALVAVLFWDKLFPEKEMTEIPIQAQVLLDEVIVFWQESHQHFDRRHDGANYQEKALDYMEEIFLLKTSRASERKPHTRKTG